MNGTQTFENGEKDPANHTKSTHVYEINDHDSSKHDKKHECCGAIIETATHSGGTATCQVKATCDICKSAYGALGDHNYDKNSWGYKSTDGHAHNCQTAGCTAHDTVIGHTSSGAATKDVAETCTECGYIISPALGHKLSGGAIAGITVGSTAVVGVGGFSLFWFVIKKKKFTDLIAIFKKK